MDRSTGFTVVESVWTSGPTVHAQRSGGRVFFVDAGFDFEDDDRTSQVGLVCDAVCDFGKHPNFLNRLSNFDVKSCTNYNTPGIGGGGFRSCKGVLLNYSCGSMRSKLETTTSELSSKRYSRTVCRKKGTTA